MGLQQLAETPKERGQNFRTATRLGGTAARLAASAVFQLLPGWDTLAESGEQKKRWVP